MSAPPDIRLDATLTQQVNDAFRSFHSVLALSRSPLANSPLVTPALVRDPVSPGADERGHALRLVLQWAVGLLAPEPPRYPLGTPRPYDDPAWRDPRWWRYNILRHRYIEPLHPDEFVEGGRYTETLIALTGISSPDAFFEERNRAIREVTAWLRQQIAAGATNEALQRMALEDALRPLDQRPAARALLDIAATFDAVFPRALLLQIAADERVAGVEAALSALIGERLLRSGDDGADLWLAPVLRAYLYNRQQAEARRARHHSAARYYEAEREPLDAARHWQRAGQWPAAARILAAAATALVNELQIGELRAALLEFRPDDLPPEQWRELQVMLCDLSLRLGQRDEALAACRAALKAGGPPAWQARVFRRMGKLYEQHNQPLALSYYQQAAEHMAAADPELVTLLKDRAWLYILRREWVAAEADLEHAQSRAPAAARETRADIFDARSNLCRQQGRFAQAVEYARHALALREELGSLPRIADSLNNLGLLYSAMGDDTHAIAAFHEALATYRRIDNRERVAGVLLNVGMAHHLAGRRREAVAAYNDCLRVAGGLDLRLIRARAHYNLAEALAELGEEADALEHWRAGYDLSLAAGFDDELRDFAALGERFPALGAPPPAPQPAPGDQAPAALDPDERAILELARRQGSVSARSLIEALSVSKATATRRLADLARRGLLQLQGKGRATSYSLAASAPPGDDSPAERLSRLLRERADWLAASYAVTALDLDQAPPEPAALRVVVRFTRLPDLRAFFDLERWLSGRLGCPVDLRLG